MPRTVAASGSPRDPEKIAAAAAELDGFSALLEEHGVTVRRPSIEPNVGFQTPHFSTSIANGLWLNTLDSAPYFLSDHSCLYILDTAQLRAVLVPWSIISPTHIT